MRMIQVNLSEREFEEFKRLKERLGLRLNSEVLRYLIMNYPAKVEE
jgi:ribosomal protein S6